MSTLPSLIEQFTELRNWMLQQIQAALPFARDGKVDLTSPHFVGSLPPTRLPPSATTIRGATDYDDSIAPADGQAIIWDDALGKYHPATPPTGITSLAALSDVVISAPQQGDSLIYLVADGKWHNSRPAQTIMLNGEPLTLGGETLTLGV